ncbi:MAG: carboxypeptidase-like regulatory domain-containing protein [Planctomycetota bacterium]
MNPERLWVNVRLIGSSITLPGIVSKTLEFAVPGLPRESLEIMCTGYGVVPLALDYDPGPEPVQRLDLEVETTRIVQVYLVDAEGEDAFRQLATGGVNTQDLWAVAAGTGTELALLPMATGSRYGLGPVRFRRRDFRNLDKTPEDCFGVVEVTTSDPLTICAFYRHLMIGSAPLPPTGSEVRIPIQVDAVRAMPGSVRAAVHAPGSDRPGAGSFRITNRGSGRSDRLREDGTLEATGLAPGFWEVHVQVDGYGHACVPFLLEPGVELDLGTIRLDPATRIAGRVLDARSAPIPATISVHRLDHQLAGAMSNGSDRTRADKDGAFEFGSVGRGRYLILASHERAIGWQSVDTSSGPVVDVELRIHTHQDVEVDNRLGPYDTRLLELHTSTGLPVWIRDVDASWKGPLRLPAGDYIVRLHRVEGPPLEDRLHVGTDGGTLTLR